MTQHPRRTSREPSRADRSAINGADDLDSRQLQTFLKIVKLGSISKAAEALGITQPSLSQHLGRLEEALQVKLFRRTARGVALTEAGRILEERARTILQAIEQAQKDVHQLNDERGGRVSLAVPLSANVVLGVPLVKAAQKHAANISLRLMEAPSETIRLWLEDGRADLGLLYDVDPQRQLSVKRLLREELFLIGPPRRTNDKRRRDAVTLRELTKLPLILPSPNRGLRQFLEQQAQRLSVTLNVDVEFDALSQIADLIAAGYGYSILPLSLVRESLAAGRVHMAAIENAAFRRTLCLVRNPNTVVTRASVRIEDLTLNLIRQLLLKKRWHAEPDVDLPSMSRTARHAGSTSPR